MEYQGVRAVEQTSPPRGFSLIELLVALAVVAIMLGSVALAVRQPASRALSTEFTRFEQILQVSADRAASLGREHRMLLGPTGYRVEERLLSQWTALEGMPLQPRVWPTGWQAVASPSEVVISPQGLVTPLRLTLTMGEESASMAWDALGRRLP